jgi:hypothetical protein
MYKIMKLVICTYEWHSTGIKNELGVDYIPIQSMHDSFYTYTSIALDL